MEAASGVGDPRARFEATLHGLPGRRLLAVDYWDVHNFAAEPARWDYGDWHHAVMGVGLSTDAGPVTVTWTNTFYPYSVEVFHDRIQDHLVLGEAGPQRVRPHDESGSPSDRYLGTPIRRTASAWNWSPVGWQMAASSDLHALMRDIGFDDLAFLR